MEAFADNQQRSPGPVGIVSNIDGTAAPDPCAAVVMWIEEQRPVASRLPSPPGHGFLLHCPQKFNEPG